MENNTPECQFCNDHKKGWPLILASNEIVRTCEECYECGNFHGNGEII